MKNRDLARQEFTDKVRLDLGTEVQFFEFTFDDMVLSSMIPAIITMLLFWLTTIDTMILFGMYGASVLTIFVFYLIYGTNINKQ
jgi:hypothetical protein